MYSHSTPKEAHLLVRSRNVSRHLLDARVIQQLSREDTWLSDCRRVGRGRGWVPKQLKWESPATAHKNCYLLKIATWLRIYVGIGTAAALTHKILTRQSSK
eukprot:scaffold16048_cov79-Skeletonema_dohrnii-CCMP3373.AAC.2